MPEPKPSMAIVGASADQNKFGNKAVRAYKQLGYTVYPVNPKETEIEGLRCYKSLDEITGPIDIVSFYLPPKLVPGLIEVAAKKGVKTVWLNPGTESDEAVERAEKLGIKTQISCSIVAAGVSPSSL
jgi:predicted CoA-binding protein